MNFKNSSTDLPIFWYFKPIIYGQPKLPKIALPGTILVDVLCLKRSYGNLFLPGKYRSTILAQKVHDFLDFFGPPLVPPTFEKWPILGGTVPPGFKCFTEPWSSHLLSLNICGLAGPGVRAKISKR